MIIWRRVKQSSQAASFVKEILSEHLNRGERLFWLIPGGSAAEISVQVANKLAGIRDLDKLAISLTDERYGRVGHADSNWRQLLNKGLSLDGATLLPVLKGKSLSQTASDYSRLLNDQLKASSYSMALAGIGPDGHIFGIKPGSPAIDSTEDVVGYDWDDFSRLTPTYNFIQKLDNVIIYAIGEEKAAQFKLLEQNISPNDQPAQFLKRLKKVIILNDYKGEYL